MDDLEDIDVGIWSVQTETSEYLIDLRTRRLKRIPGQGLGLASPHDRVVLLLAELEGDHQWTPLLELLRCRVGEPLIALVAPHENGNAEVRQSTHVRRISRLDTPGDAEHHADASDEAVFYDRNADPIDEETFRHHFADDDYRFLRRDPVGDLEVVTAWLGADQTPGQPGPPMIFGTAAVTLSGELHEDLEYFAPGETEALVNHERMLIRLLKAARARTKGDRDAGSQG